MSDNQNQTDGSELKSPEAIVGVSLVVSGALVTLTGLAIGGTHLLSSLIRKRISELETPPTEAARRKWAQARAAATAGNRAWHNGQSRQPAHSA